MSAFQPIIQQGAQGEFYEVDGIKYTGTFPYQWAIDHKGFAGEGFTGDICSGPKRCANCRVRGSINGVFVFYCANCSEHIYDGEMHPKRNGYIYAVEDLNSDEELWEACPYMHGIPRSQIGDKVAQEEPTSDEDEDRFFSYYAADNVIQREIEGQKLREFNERQLQMASEFSLEEGEQEAEEEVDEEEEKARYIAELEYQIEEQDRRYYEDEEDYYEAYRDNDDYYDQWDEPYSREYPITRRELMQVPADMRAAFDPEYQSALANFRAAAMEK
jgi:hypothetical protein